jgi:hypothetical protein
MVYIFIVKSKELIIRQKTIVDIVNEWLTSHEIEVLIDEASIAVGGSIPLEYVLSRKSNLCCLQNT